MMSALVPPASRLDPPPADLIPDEEPERLLALRRYEVLDSPPEQSFDDFARLAAEVCDAPTAVITLVDAQRQWFKAKIGLPAKETARDGFCSHCILQPELMIVPDALEDPRMRSHENVAGPPHIRFYAGVPLVTQDGFAIGTLCVLDYVPRALTSKQQDALRTLARQVMTQLELRRLALEGRRSLAAQRSVQRVGLGLLTSRQPEDAAGRLAAAFCTFARSPRTVILEYDESTATLRGLADSADAGGPIAAVRLRLDECPVAQRTLLGDTPQRSWEVDDPGALGKGLGIESYACVPVSFEDRTLGVAVLDRPDEIDDAVLSLASLGGAALDRARSRNGDGGAVRRDPTLTEQELNIMRLVAQGLSNPEIGVRLYLSRHTVKEYCGNAMRKLGVHSRLEAVLAAKRLGLILDEAA